MGILASQLLRHCATFELEAYIYSTAQRRRPRRPTDRPTGTRAARTQAGTASTDRQRHASPVARSGPHSRQIDDRRQVTQPLLATQAGHDHRPKTLTQDIRQPGGQKVKQTDSAKSKHDYMSNVASLYRLPSRSQTSQQAVRHHHRSDRAVHVRPTRGRR